MTDRTKCIRLYDKIVTAFHNQSGGKWNDTMYYQSLGANEEMDEAEADGNWEYALKNLTKCWVYQKHCALLDEMSENMPESVYC